jgi:ATP-binding cassette, subfamily B, bacterial PglK
MSAFAQFPTFGKVWLILNKRERRLAVLQLLLTIIGMFLEMLGIGLVIPAVMVMTQDDLGSKYPLVQPYLDALGNPTKTQLVLGGMLVLVSVYFVKTGFLAFLAWRQNRFAFGIRVRLSEQLLKTYLRQPYMFHLMRNSAMLVRNAQYETQQLVQGGLRPCMTLISEFLLILGVAIVLLLVEPVGALLVVTVLGIATLVFHHFTRRRITRWGETRRHSDGLRIKHMQQALSSVKDIKLMGREREFLARYENHNRRAAVAAEKQATLAHLPKLWLELLAVTGLALLVATMVFQGRDIVSILPILGVFGAAAFRMLPSVNKLLNAAQSMRFSSTVIDSLYAELQLPAPEGAAHGQAPVAEFENEIRVSNVSFTYAGANRPALSDLSFRVAKGESVGLVGPSGSGKSTVIDVILGLLTPQAGIVSVDSEDIQADLRRWQDQIGYVPQAIYLADESLLRNVAFGIAPEQIDATAVSRALKAAQLEEFVAGLPNGLETVVGERGVRLSGGQRQRIGIARALYHDPAVLVLDEATSALDSATEHGVMGAVEALHGSKTILIVAHRLSTVENCDRILRLHEGRLVEEGAPGKLLATQGEPKPPVAANIRAK